MQILWRFTTEMVQWENLSLLPTDDLLHGGKNISIPLRITLICLRFSISLNDFSYEMSWHLLNLICQVWRVLHKHRLNVIAVVFSRRTPLESSSENHCLPVKCKLIYLSSVGVSFRMAADVFLCVLSIGPFLYPAYTLLCQFATFSLTSHKAYWAY